MELGNLAFGNSRGNFPISREAGYEGLIHLLFEHMGISGYGEDFDNEVFTIRPYYWGDCVCGYEDKSWKWSEANKHREGCYQDDLKKIERPTDKQYKALCEKHGIAYDDGRGCAVHCTCDYRDRWGKFCEENGHAKDCLIILPNFHHKKSGLTIDWYKYPLRDSYSNQKMNLKEFNKIIQECIASLPPLKE